MNYELVYRPYANEKWCVVPCWFCTIFFLVFAGYFSPRMNMEFLVCLLFGIFSSWLAKSLYDASNITMYFEIDGLRITEGRFNGHHYFSWNSFQYAYCCRFHGQHWAVILSREMLTWKQAKRCAYLKLFSKNGNVVVIYCNGMRWSKYGKEILEAVRNKLPHVESEGGSVAF